MIPYRSFLEIILLYTFIHLILSFFRPNPCRLPDQENSFQFFSFVKRKHREVIYLVCELRSA